MSRQSWRRGGAGRWKLFRLPWAFGEGGVALSLCDGFPVVESGRSAGLEHPTATAQGMPSPAVLVLYLPQQVPRPCMQRGLPFTLTGCAASKLAS